MISCVCESHNTAQWQWERGVYLALRLTKYLFGGDVADEVLTVLRPSEFDSSYLENARRILFTERGGHLSTSNYYCQDYR